MKTLLLGPVTVFALGWAAHAYAEPAARFHLSSPPVLGGDSSLLRPLAFDAEEISIDNAQVQSFRSATRLVGRADAYGETVSAELRAPLALTNGKLFFRPFLGAGGGFGTSSVLDGATVHPSDGLLWTTKVGLYVRTSAKVVWQLSYRHVQTPDFNTKRSAFASRVSAGADVAGIDLRFILGR